MPPAAIPQNRVRRTSKSQYKSFKALKELDCWPRVDALVKKGMPVTEVAEMIHERWHEALDWTRTKLERTLRDYRKRIPDEDLFHAVMPQEHVDAIKNTLEEFDALEELAWLWKQQKRRLMIDMRHEEKGNKLFKQTYREVETGIKILKTYSDIRMDRGLDDRHLGTLEVNAGPNVPEVRETHGEKVAAALEDPKKASRVLAASDRILGLLARTGEDVIDITPDADAEDEEDSDGSGA